MKPNPWSFVSIGVLAFAAWQTVTTLSHTPAFNRSLRTETGGGGGILGFTEAMYDRAEYHYWIALGWQGRIDSLAPPGEPATRLQQEAVQAGYARIRDAATESLRHNPGKADAWMFVAKSQAVLGQPDVALAAYRRWHDLAPHRASSASARLSFLADFMRETENRDRALSVIDPAIIEADLRVLHGGTHRQRGLHLANDPAIAAFGIEVDDQP